MLKLSSKDRLETAAWGAAAMAMRTAMRRIMIVGDGETELGGASMAEERIFRSDRDWICEGEMRRMS